MSDDVTIDRETAKEWAAFLRSSTRDRLNPDWTPLADLLDPPQPSLFDAVADVIRRGVFDQAPGAFIARDVLAVVRKRIEGLPTRPLGLDCRVEWMARDDVLAVLGGDDE